MTRMLWAIGSEAFAASVTVMESLKADLSHPLAKPVFVDDVAMLEFFQRYNLMPLTPVSKFEYQLVCIATGLEQRIRELEPDVE